MNTINSIVCKAQGNHWLEVSGIYEGCATHDRLVLVLTAIITLITMLLIMWVWASIRCMWMQYKLGKANRVIAAMAMAQGKE